MIVWRITGKIIRSVLCCIVYSCTHSSIHTWAVSYCCTMVCWFRFSVGFYKHFCVFKPPPPVGAGGGYMFLGRPSVPPSVRASVRASVIYVVVLCFCDISNICWRIFAKLLSLVHLGTQMTWLRIWVEKGQRSRSHHRGGGAQHSTLPSSATFSSCQLGPVFYG